MKTVVITGCSVGVGRAAALRFDREGWQVYAIVRKQADAEKLRADATGPLRTVLADVAMRDQLFDAAGEIGESCGAQGLDGLVCNAGVGAAGPLEFIPTAELAKPVDTNFYGTIFSVQAFLPLLRLAKGRIVTVTSGSTLLTMPLVSTYPAAKYALELLTRQLRVELAHFGIKVILIDPGHIRTRVTLSSKDVHREAMDQLPAEAFDLYGTLLDRLEATVSKMAGSGKDPDVVAQTYVRALTDPKPKSMYLVGADAKIMRAFNRVMPQRVIDAAAAQIMKS